MKRLCVTIAVIVAIFPSTALAGDKATKILLIGKDRDHPYATHEYMTDCALLATCLKQTANVETTVSNGWPKNADTLKDVKAVKALDGRTVEIDVARAYAPLLGDLANFPIVSPTAVARWGDAFGSHPVGSGPYAFESWEVGEQVVLHRFDDYWGDKPALDRIVFQVVVDARQRLIDLESGSVDLATSIRPTSSRSSSCTPISSSTTRRATTSATSRST